MDDLTDLLKVVRNESTTPRLVEASQASRYLEDASALISTFIPEISDARRFSSQAEAEFTVRDLIEPPADF